jgi:hypothetical protein
MKKIIFVLTLLLLVSPALATVNLSCTSDNSGVVSVYYALSDANLPRAFGLNVTLNNDANIVSAGNFNPDFWVHPGSIDINTNVIPPVIDSNGSAILSSVDYPQAGGLVGPPDSNGMTIEMGSLYYGSPNRPDPNTDLLFTFTVDADCNVIIAGNTALGNVVMESTAQADVIYTGCSVAIVAGCPTCTGDVNGDDWLKTNDISALVTILNNAGAPYRIPDTDPLYDICADVNLDQWVKTNDISALVTILNNIGAPYRQVCP